MGAAWSIAWQYEAQASSELQRGISTPRSIDLENYLGLSSRHLGNSSYCRAVLRLAKFTSGLAPASLVRSSRNFSKGESQMIRLSKISANQLIKVVLVLTVLPVLFAS